MTIIPLPRKVSQAPMSTDVRPLAWALSRMEPESLALILPGESLDDCRARRAAGLDILEELLAEFPADDLDGDVDPVDALSALLTLGGAA